MPAISQEAFKIKLKRQKSLLSHDIFTNMVRQVKLVVTSPKNIIYFKYCVSLTVSNTETKSGGYAQKKKQC